MRTLYYDVETDSEHPQYANLSLVGILVEDTKLPLDDGVVYTWESPFTEEKLSEIQVLLCEEGIRRVGFNSLNYDDIVLANHGIIVPEEGTEDAFLAVKTVYPDLPAHGLKFLCWYLFGDHHWAEFKMKQSGARFDGIVTAELEEYHKYDLLQHKMVWEWIKADVYSPRHLEAYKLDMGMKFPLQEMTFEGGVYVDMPKAEKTLAELEVRKTQIQELVQLESGGKVKNANSNRQVGKYLSEVENFELDLTATGEFQVKKKDLADITGMTDEEMRAWTPGIELPEGFSSVALLAWQMKDNENVRKYVKNYHAAAVGTGQGNWIPSAYSISRATTRRTLSKSFYKINFQNSTETIDSFKLIPPGYLGWYIDSTQVENVVHIYESNDIARRASYEAESEWNEYVWLCNRVLGTNKSKKELDSIKSKQVPHWSVYKLYKTVKLALNFGMGIKKFCATLNIPYEVGKAIFEDIHRACPAIRYLQRKVKINLERNGYVQDTFGHVYKGKEDYKVVAYLIQGCGTGSLPKAQMRANYDTLHSWSEQLGVNVGPLSETTHDENGGFLRLDLGEEVIRTILTELMENMTSKFSPKFDGIPLRAKLYTSITNKADKKKYESSDFRSNIILPLGTF